MLLVAEQVYLSTMVGLHIHQKANGYLLLRIVFQRAGFGVGGGETYPKP